MSSSASPLGNIEESTYAASQSIEVQSQATQYSVATLDELVDEELDVLVSHRVTRDDTLRDVTEIDTQKVMRIRRMNTENKRDCRVRLFDEIMSRIVAGTRQG